MKDTLTLNGIEYELVPVKKNIETNVTFYYACDSDCGYFKFNILLNEDGSIWENTQSVTYYPNGRNDKCEYWDNSDFLRDILRDKKIPKYSNSNEALITQHHEQTLVDLLEQVHKKGWI